MFAFGTIELLLVGVTTTFSLVLNFRGHTLARWSVVAAISSLLATCFSAADIASTLILAAVFFAVFVLGTKMPSEKTATLSA